MAKPGDRPPDKFVRVVRANHGETVEIQWRLDDGTTYAERHTLPPKATRESRRDADAEPPAEKPGDGMAGR